MMIRVILRKIEVVKRINCICKSRWFYPFLLFIFGLLPILWFHKDYVIRPEELSYINYSFLFEKYLYAWSTHTSNGLPSTYADQLILFPIGFIYAILEKLNVGEQQIQKIILILFFESALFLSYNLFKRFTKNSKLAFIVAIFYVYNFYTLSIPFYTAKMIQQIMIPAIFSITLKYMESKKLRYIFTNFIVFFLLQGIFSNLANAISTMTIYVLAILYYIYANKKNVHIIDQIKPLIIYFIGPLIIVINIGLIFFYSVLNNNLYTKLRETNGFAHTFLSTPISKIFTLFHGAWWETSEIYNPWFPHFNNPIITIMAVILFTLLITGFLTTKNGNKNNHKFYIFWFLSFCAFIFITKGINQPLGSIYKLIFFNVPGFFVFREPWAKFTPLVIFSASFVFLYTIKSISSNKKIINMIFIAVLLVNLPFLSGKAISHIGFGYSDTDILIPKYWKDMHNWSKSKENKNLNIFTTPIIYGTQEYYNWQGYEKGNLTGSFVYTYLYSNSVNKLDDPTGTHYESLKTYSPNLLSLFNIDHVLDQSDVVKVGRNINYSIDKLINDGVIANRPFISFDKLSLYELQPRYKLPRIYIPQIIHEYISKDETVLPIVLNTSPNEYAPAYISTPGNMNIKKEMLDSTVIVVNKVNSNIQTLNDWDTGWAWPIDVNISPKSWRYNIVKISEFIKEHATLDKLDKVDRNLWFAGKRIAEIQKFTPDGQTQKKLLEDYTAKTEYALNALQNSPESERDEKFWGAVKKSLMYIQKYHDTGVLEKTPYKEKNISKLNAFQSWLQNKVNPYCNKNCFEITAHETGTYQLYISNSEIRKVWPNKDNLKNYQDGVMTYIIKTDEFTNNVPTIIKITPIYKEELDTSINVGQLELLKDQTYYIDISFLDKMNMIDKGTWETPGVSNQSDYEIELNPQDAIEDYTLDEDGNPKIWNNTIKFKKVLWWDADNDYKLTFNYRTDNGELGFSIVEDIYDISAISEGRINNDFTDIKDSSIIHRIKVEENLYSKCNQPIKSDSCWVKYEKLVRADSLSVGASIYMYAIPNSKNFSKVSIKDITVEPILNLKPILILNTNTNNKDNKPTISYEMVNPTKYNIKVQNATSNYIIVFSQTFHTGWKLYYNKTQIANNQHEIVNGFANAWNISPSDTQMKTDYNLTLEYSPQKVLYFTWGITILTFIVSMIYLLYEVISKNGHKIDTTSINTKHVDITQYLQVLKNKKYKSIAILLVTITSMYIVLEEFKSLDSRLSIFLFVLIWISVLVIIISNINYKYYIYFVCILISTMLVLILFKYNAISEILAIWAYSIILVIAIMEFIKICKDG